MNCFEFREETQKRVLECRADMKKGEFERALHKANALGFEVFKKLKEESKELEYLYFLDLKELILLSITCVEERRCDSCFVKHMSSVLNFLKTVRVDPLFSLDVRLGVGLFLNSLVVNKITGHYQAFFSESEVKPKYHLQLVS